MLSAPPEPVPIQRERYSFRRMFSSKGSSADGSVSFHRQSSRSIHHTSRFSRGGSTREASGNQRRTFSFRRRAVSMFNSPPSVFDQYDTTSLNSFIREAFNDAVLLEEHQVCLKDCMLVTSTDVWIFLWSCICCILLKFLFRVQ